MNPNVLTIDGSAEDHVHPVAMVHPPDARAETVPGLTAVHLAGLIEGLSPVPVQAGRIAGPGANGRAGHVVTTADRANGVNRRHRCRKST